MKARAIQQNIHVSARKAGLVCDLIRNKKVTEAITILENADKKVAPILKKLLQSAIANATNNHAMNANLLYIYHVVANQGRTIKRALPRAKGSSNMIRKRHCHLEIILSDDQNQRSQDLLAVKAKIQNRSKNNSKISKAKVETKKEQKVMSSKPQINSKPKIEKGEK